MIKYGADLNSKDKASWTPLHYAALHEDPSILNELLMQFGVKKDCKDENWNTPLMVAAEAGNHVAVNCLMDEGADLCCLNQDKANFFDIALEYQRESVCEGIVKHNRSVYVSLYYDILYICCLVGLGFGFDPPNRLIILLKKTPSPELPVSFSRLEQITFQN